MTNPFAAPGPAEVARLDANWRAITAEIDAPRAPFTERVLSRLGLPRSLTRLLVATPSLRRSWFIAMALAVFVGLAATDAADPRRSIFTFLVIAPLVPLIGVAMAYGADADPAHEITLATPMRGLRLLMIRTCTVLCLSIGVLGPATLLTPEPTLVNIAWLLPSLALTSANLATMTILPPRRAGQVTAAAWIGLVVLSRIATTDPLAAFGPAGQVGAVLVTIVGLAVLVVRRQKLDLLGATR